MTPKARGLPLQRVAKPEAQRYEAADKGEPALTRPDQGQHDREDLICRIRHMFGDGEETRTPCCDRRSRPRAGPTGGKQAGLHL